MKYKVSEQFSKTPSARTEKEGKHPGVNLRSALAPLIKKCIEDAEELTIELDGTHGYGTSFLEEVFGGLIREEHFRYEDLKNTLNFISEEEPELIDEIWQDIEDARDNETDN